MHEIHYLLIIPAALIASGSPGPATLAILGTSMKQGRAHGLALASGILTGSLMWSILAAFGFSAFMYSTVWLFELIRYLGGVYLLYLAYKSFKASRLSAKHIHLDNEEKLNYKKTYLKGLLLHLTNPKAILFFGALYSIGVPKGVPLSALFEVIFVVGCTSFLVFIGYAILFSISKIRDLYIRLRKTLELTFAVIFGALAMKILLFK
ncbi:LysE family translocator [Sulfurospirillum arcachonense]|uniref:LysE family translocator n=1 Tax=Sulfurospirillum arcachonense TaxID=57666 RepID=UPI000468B2CC|nr:LysE family translocator [Sulfurospirillum arcachonense]